MYKVDDGRRCKNIESLDNKKEDKGGERGKGRQSLQQSVCAIPKAQEGPGETFRFSPEWKIGEGERLQERSKNKMGKKFHLNLLRGRQ